MTENALNLVSIMDVNGTLCYASPSHEQAVGFEPEELCGKNAFEFVHPDDLPKVLELLARGLPTPQIVTSAEYRFRHKDGSWRVMESTAKNLLDNPAVAGILVNSRDVTEQKRVEEEKAALLRARQEEGEISASLARVGQEMISSLDTPELLARLCKVSAEILDCDASHTFLWQPEEGAYTLAAEYGGGPEEKEVARVVKVPADVMARQFPCLNSGSAAQVSAICSELICTPRQGTAGARPQLCMPLRHGGETIGVHIASSFGGGEM